MKKILLVFLLSTYQLFSSAIFVDPSEGSDSFGTGSQTNPYKTLNKAGEVLNNRDTIYIKGSFHDSVKQEFRRQDNQLTWVYIRPFNNQNVTLSGQGASFLSYEAILGIQSSKYVDIKGIIVKDNNQGPGIRVVSDAAPNWISQFVRIKNCRANNIWRHGILVQASDVTIDSCEIDSVVLRNRFQALGNGGWESALGTFLNPIHSSFFQNRNIIFRNNFIHNVWGEGIALVRTRNFVVENNTIQNCFSACIHSDNSRYGLIQNNWISSTSDYYNISYTGYSGPANGIIWAAEGLGNYAYDSIVRNIDIFNNLIVRTSSAFGWFDDPDNPFNSDSYKNINIYFNTVFDTKGYQTFYMDTSNVNPNRILPDSCNFKNNIICRPKYMNNYERYFTLSNDFNLAWSRIRNCFIQGSSGIPNNYFGSPSFVDSTVNLPANFKLATISICRDSGIFIPQCTTDFWNAGRDGTPSIGFHEYGGVSLISIISNLTPSHFTLSQNYPNPFNPATKIKFDIPVSVETTRGVVSLKIHDILGREVAVLVNEQLKPGSYEVDWDASAFPSGVYFYTINSGSFKETRKMVLLK